jgi:hypothetical protein
MDNLNTIYFEYLRDGKIEAVIEIKPQFTKKGYLTFWHSFIIRCAMENKHPDGTKYDEVKIHHRNPF